MRLPADVETREANFSWENGRSRTVSFDAVMPCCGSAAPGTRVQRIPAAAAGRSETRISPAEDRKRRGRTDPLSGSRPRRNARSAGIAVSVYGLRSDRNWGCGDFTDLQHFTNGLTRHLGVAFVALNPLHSIPNRQPYNTSPYLPNCSFYRNGIYIDIERIPDIQQSSPAHSACCRRRS